MTDDEIKDFVALNFSENVKSAREKLYSKLSEEQNPTKVADPLYNILATPDGVEKYTKMMQSSSFDNCINRYSIDILYLFDSELQLIKTTPMI